MDSQRTVAEHVWELREQVAQQHLALIRVQRQLHRLEVQLATGQSPSFTVPEVELSVPAAEMQAPHEPQLLASISRETTLEQPTSTVPDQDLKLLPMDE